MKANEAPEKLYYAPYGDIREDYPITDNDIEYTRTDTFIEKACEWLRYYVNLEAGTFLFDEDIEKFRKAMKGG